MIWALQTFCAASLRLHTCFFILYRVGGRIPDPFELRQNQLAKTKLRDKARTLTAFAKATAYTRTVVVVSDAWID